MSGCDLFDSLDGSLGFAASVFAQVEQFGFEVLPNDEDPVGIEFYVAGCLCSADLDFFGVSLMYHADVADAHFSCPEDFVDDCDSAIFDAAVKIAYQVAHLQVYDREVTKGVDSGEFFDSYMDRISRIVAACEERLK